MDEKPLSWEQIQVFLAAARTGTLSGGARHLQSSAATVLRRMRALEKKLQVQLFMRSSRGYALTAAGSELLVHAQAMEAEMLTAQRRLGGRDQRLSGAILISTLDDLVQTVLGPVLAGFSQRHPSVELNLQIDSEFTNLSHRTADVAIRAGAVPKTPDVIARRVCEIGVALYASREYLRRRPVASASGLGGHQIVRADQGRAHLPMETLIDRYAPGAHAAFRSNSMLARCSAVRDGIGVGFLPCFVADTERHLVRLGSVVPEASAALWLLIHADLRRNARVRTFVEHAHDELLRVADQLAGSG